jgi:bifunctional DNA-binding transcriptional regulator/antitoxin component of YhaV-PrlF toxin-antitoxin module
MSEPITLQLAQRGVLTLPKALREAYDLNPGDTLTLLDLGGVFVVSPRLSRLSQVANELAAEWEAGGETLESILLTLREVRERYEE